MAKVFIITHANSTWNELGLWQGHCDTELSKIGLMMSRQLADCTTLHSVKQIYSSDLRRAYQTVEPLADKLRLEIIQDPYLREGRWVDHDIQEGVEVLPAPYDFESKEKLQERAIQTLSKITSQSGSFPILVVTHGTFLECFINSLVTACAPIYKGIRTAINSFEFTDNDWTINELNNTSHLPEVTDSMICVLTKTK